MMEYSAHVKTNAPPVMVPLIGTLAMRVQTYHKGGALTVPTKEKGERTMAQEGRRANKDKIAKILMRAPIILLAVST